MSQRENVRSTRSATTPCVAVVRHRDRLKLQAASALLTTLVAGALLASMGCAGPCVRHSDCPSALVCQVGSCVQPPVDDGGEPLDGAFAGRDSSAMDGAVIDGSMMDSSMMDAAMSDAAMPDAGPSGLVDGGMDAGAMMDTGSLLDAAPPMDAGDDAGDDAGSSDAGDDAGVDAP